MKLTFKQLSEDTLLIEWPDEPNEQTLNEILSYENAIETNISEGIVECYPAYRSLAVSFDAIRLSSSELIERISNLSINNIPVKSTLWCLPVCYDQAVGADLINFAGMKSMSPAQLTEIHCSATYRVHFFGFLPGFMYLSGLDSRLYHPRKDTPDRRIEPGSVAIGGTQTGIYPTTSPGGWHVIGNCPIPLFEVNQKPPCFIHPGDHIVFKPISIEEHHELQYKAKSGSLETSEFYG